MNARDLSQLLLETLRSPRAAAERLLTLDLARPVLWQLLILIVAVGMLLTHLQMAMSPVPIETMPATFRDAPLVSAVFLVALTAVMAALLSGIGQVFGGAGRFDTVLLLLIWLQFVLTCLQALQILFMVILPPVAGILGILGLGLMMVMLVVFTTVAHGFGSIGHGLLVVVLTLFALALVMLATFAIFGGAVGMESAHVRP